MVAAIKTATAVEPVVLGKPEPGLFHIGLHRLGGLPPTEAVMIGDRLDTDIAGAHRAGHRAILVLSGVTTLAQAEAASQRPDAVVADLASVAGLLGWD
jgi:4-nitrophenyl phosphatase